MFRAAFLSAILLVPALGMAAPTQPDATSEAWWDRTLLDRDRDGVDDALAPMLDGQDPLVVLVAYERMPGREEQAALAETGAQVLFAPRHFPLLVARSPPEAILEIARLPGVVLVESNDRIERLLKESAPLIGATRAWSDYGVTGRGIVVAVLDDGAHEEHPDLKAKVVASYNAASSRSPVASGSDVVVPAGEKGHATHVAGTIAGPGAESGGVYRGIAHESRFVNVQVFSGPDETTSDIVLRGLDWVVSHRERYGIRIVQMSLGGRVSDGTDALSRAVDIAVDRGLVVVAASGNGGPSKGTVTSPGAAEKAITVGAVDKRKSVASFSGRGPTLDGRTKPDLVAPGVAVTSTVPPTSTTGVGSFVSGGRTVYYGALSGTSMAAPHVAGVAALMLEARPDLAPLEVKRILLATAQDLHDAGKDNATGFGFVNAVAAVQVAHDPALLDSSKYRDALAAIPEPAPESVIDRLSYEAQSALRGGNALALAAGTAFVVLIVSLAIVGRARSR